MIIGFILGFYCGVCYTCNIDALVATDWRTFLGSPINVPWRIYKFFHQPPEA